MSSEYMANTTQDRVHRSVSDRYATISRTSATFHSHTGRLINGTREVYPTNKQIRRLAGALNARDHTAGHLARDDLIWSAAMVSDVKLKKRSEAIPEYRDEYLDDLISVGILDRQDGDVRNAAEEKSMRYAASCSSMVMDHVTALESKVRLCTPS
jgi:hypothetical protein